MASSLRVKSVVHNFEETYSSLVGHSSCRMEKKGIVNYAYNAHHRISQAPRRLSVVNTKNCYYRADDSRCNYSLATSPSSGSSSRSEFDVSQWGSLISSKGYKRRMHDKGDDVSGKLDKWVKDSVVEILNNLDEAPFLVHIYSDGEEGSLSPRKTRLVREKAAAETWPLIKGRWGIGSPTPSGIIVVAEMKNIEEDEGDSSSPCGENVGSTASETCSSTRVWGILIQGRGISCPACYILKTCRVRSVLGFCTHFCLARVECFFETVDIQFKKLWLV